MNFYKKFLLRNVSSKNEGEKMNIRKQKQDASIQPYLISISPENYRKLEELRISEGLKSRNDTLTELLNQVIE